jgi:hypothetical protein
MRCPAQFDCPRRRRRARYGVPGGWTIRGSHAILLERRRRGVAIAVADEADTTVKPSVPGMPLTNLHVLEETLVGGDAYTTSTLARVRIGEQSWQWYKQLVFVRVLPDLVSDPIIVNRFRESLALWRRHYLPNNPDLFHVETEADPLAMFAYDGGLSLVTICRALTPTLPLPRSIAERILDDVFFGLRSRHELGFAYGAVSLDNVSITDEGNVMLGIGAPWDPDVSPREDIRRAERLSGDAPALARSIATPYETLLEFANQFRQRLPRS